MEILEHSARRTEHSTFRSRQRISLDILSSGDLKGIISLNGQAVGDVRIDASHTFQTTSLDLNLLRWSDSIQSLELRLQAMLAPLSKSILSRFCANEIYFNTFVCLHDCRDGSTKYHLY